MKIQTFRQAETELVKKGFLFRRGLGDPAESDLASIRRGEDDVGEIRRSRISRPSVVGRTMSALCSVDNRASAFIGDNGCAFSTPLVDGWGRIAGRRFSRCFSVTQRA